MFSQRKKKKDILSIPSPTNYSRQKSYFHQSASKNRSVEAFPGLGSLQNLSCKIEGFINFIIMILQVFIQMLFRCVEVPKPHASVMYPAGWHHVEDGLPAAGPGGFGASPRRTPNSAGVGHHPKRDGGASCPIGLRPRPYHHWREEPALCQREADLAVVGGTLQEEEAVWDSQCRLQPRGFDF